MASHKFHVGVVCQSIAGKNSGCLVILFLTLLQYGKLSDIFGRKSNLTVAYIFFGVGLFIWCVVPAYPV